MVTVDEVDKNDQIKELKELTAKKTEEFEANLGQLLMKDEEIKQYEENLQTARRDIRKQKERVKEEKDKREFARKNAEIFLDNWRRKRRRMLKS